MASAATEIATAYRLEPGEQPSEGMRRIAFARADLALLRLEEAERAADPAACIHGVRKDLKKLRAVVRLLRRELGEELYRSENERYREAGRVLSETRDAEVKLETLAALGAEGTDEWRLALERERDAALERARDGEAIARARAAIAVGRDRIAAWPLGHDSWKLVGPGLTRAYRRGRRAMRVAAREGGDEAMHEWRKRAKDLWYQLRVLRDFRPPAQEGALGLAGELAERLGDHHDLVVLREDLFARELPTPTRPALVAAIAERQEELAAEAFGLGEELYAAKPKAFRRAMRGGWKRARS